MTNACKWNTASTCMFFLPRCFNHVGQMQALSCPAGHFEGRGEAQTASGQVSRTPCEDDKTSQSFLRIRCVRGASQSLTRKSIAWHAPLHKCYLHMTGGDEQWFSSAVRLTSHEMENEQCRAHHCKCKIPQINVVCLVLTSYFTQRSLPPAWSQPSQPAR